MPAFRFRGLLMGLVAQNLILCLLGEKNNQSYCLIRPRVEPCGFYLLRKSCILYNYFIEIRKMIVVMDEYFEREKQSVILFRCPYI